MKLRLFHFLGICHLLSDVHALHGRNILSTEPTPRFNESCGFLENAQMCEDNCGQQFQECSVVCQDQGSVQNLMTIYVS